MVWTPVAVALLGPSHDADRHPSTDCRTAATPRFPVTYAVPLMTKPWATGGLNNGHELTRLIGSVASSWITPSVYSQVMSVGT